MYTAVAPLDSELSSSSMARLPPRQARAGGTGPTASPAAAAGCACRKAAASSTPWAASRASSCSAAAPTVSAAMPCMASMTIHRSQCCWLQSDPPAEDLPASCAAAGWVGRQCSCSDGGGDGGNRCRWHEISAAFWFVVIF